MPTIGERMLEGVDITASVAKLLDTGGQVQSIGYLCIQGYPSRICAGCTSACDQTVAVVYESDDDPVGGFVGEARSLEVR
jgi:hypothetical protein